MESPYDAGLMWFRRDLRAHDNAALFHALKACRQVHCVFVFDRAILEPLPRRDRRVEFIRESLLELDRDLRERAGSPGAGLIVRHAIAIDELPRLARDLAVQAVFANHDYEPQSMVRDESVRDALQRQGVAFHTFKDQVIFEREEILTRAGTPYSVFTPYRTAWLAKLDSFYLKSYPVRAHAAALAERPPALRLEVPDLGTLGFESGELRRIGIATGASGGRRLFEEFMARIADYQRARDFPALKGPSYLSVHLRFGTVSIRELAARAHELANGGDPGAATWLAELIWREFYFQVLANFPHVADSSGRSHSFKPAYDAIPWEQGEAAQTLFDAWCEGRTGYPLVDAAMAQINQTGYMHNRLRMVVASFLTKDLGIDWRWGERYFARQLNDYDLAANNGGWQWASSSGCDAQPYFRIFNPVGQSRKFDPEGKFIRRYLPQLARLPTRDLHEPWAASTQGLAAAGVELGTDYPAPVVQHDEARERTLKRYQIVRKAAR
jgi:deoxyribodipyrimidine photo-lyase